VNLWLKEKRKKIRNHGFHRLHGLKKKTIEPQRAKKASNHGGHGEHGDGK
jgi:hypothetical protein